MRRIISDTYRRCVDSRLNKIIQADKVSRSQRGSAPPPSSGPHQFDRDTILLIYRAKCAELEIPTNEISEQRFLNVRSS
jgi:hypothetical protein